MSLREPVVRIGVGGWSFPAWRGTFYPAGLAQKRELEFASGRLTSIEINATYHRTQTPQSFARWRDETPDDFVFAVKGPRYATNRAVLADAGPAIDRFFASGVTALGSKLGPINWQLMPTKRFDPDDFAAFLSLLPREVDGVELTHAVEVRHESFAAPELVTLARAHGVTVVVTDKKRYPQIADPTGPVVYARLEGAVEGIETGLDPETLAAWARRARTWMTGGVPGDLARVCVDEPPDARPRDVYLFIIGGFKQGNPRAAVELIERVRAAT